MNWQKFHKASMITGAFTLWATAVAIIIVLGIREAANDGLGEYIATLLDLKPIVYVVALAVMIVLTILSVIYSVVAYRNRAYAIAEDGIHYRAGKLFKREEHILWDRVQSVEVEQKLSARIFGFGRVKVESAGDEPLRLGLFKVADCALLRRQLLAASARVREGKSPLASQVPDVGRPAFVPGQDGSPEVSSDALVANPAAPAVAESGEHPGPQARDAAAASSGMSERDRALIFDPDDLAEDRVLVKVPTSRLIKSSMTSTTFIIGLVLAVVSILWQWKQGTSIAGFAVGFLLMIWGAAKSLFSEYGSTIALSPNGVRTRAGLTELVTTTYPPQRIHAVQLVQPMLWRPFGWWQVVIATANTDVESEMVQARSTILPVGTRAEALNVLWAVLPSLGVDDQRALIDEALTGKRQGRFFLGSPKSARWLDPLVHRLRGIALTPTAVIIRNGIVGRSVSFLLQDHYQSLDKTSGPLQRRLGLATMSWALVSRILVFEARNFDAAELDRLFWVENEMGKNARAAQVSETLEEWRKRVGV